MEEENVMEGGTPGQTVGSLCVFSPFGGEVTPFSRN